MTQNNRHARKTIIPGSENSEVAMSATPIGSMSNFGQYMIRSATSYFTFSSSLPCAHIAERQ